MKRLIKPFATVFSVLSLGACATITTTEVESPLSSDLRQALRTADIIIVGEKHDNPHHHQIQADIIDLVEAKGIAFEMVPKNKEGAINAALLTGEGTDTLRDLLDWENSGWPDWDMYAPLFVASPGAYIAGGEIDRDVARKAMSEGASSQIEDAARFGLDQPLPAEQQAALAQELIDSHCGMIPASLAVSMAEAQRLRDASFAKASLRALDQGGQPVVLITGSGHARLDRGVPLYLKTAAPELNIVSVGLTEPGEVSEELYDFNIETEAADREDPCAAFAAAMSK